MENHTHGVATTSSSSTTNVGVKALVGQVAVVQAAHTVNAGPLPLSHVHT